MSLAPPGIASTRPGRAPLIRTPEHRPRQSAVTIVRGSYIWPALSPPAPLPPSRPVPPGPFAILPLFLDSFPSVFFQCRYMILCAICRLAAGLWVRTDISRCNLSWVFRSGCGQGSGGSGKVRLKWTIQNNHKNKTKNKKSLQRGSSRTRYPVNSRGPGPRYRGATDSF